MHTRNYLLMNRFGLCAHAMMMATDTSGAGGDEFAQGEFSLADLADLDVSDIAEIRFETLPKGVYEWEVVKANLVEDVDKEGAKRFYADFEYKVVECIAALEAGVDRESLVGKKHGERQYIHPGKPKDKILEAIGRIRATVADMGCDNSGALGPMLLNTEGHRFKTKLIHQVDKDDKSKVYARLRFDPAKK